MVIHCIKLLSTRNITGTNMPTFHTISSKSTAQIVLASRQVDCINGRLIAPTQPATQYTRKRAERAERASFRRQTTPCIQIVILSKILRITHELSILILVPVSPFSYYLYLTIRFYKEQKASVGKGFEEFLALRHWSQI